MTHRIAALSLVLVVLGCSKHRSDAPAPDRGQPAVAPGGTVEAGPPAKEHPPIGPPAVPRATGPGPLWIATGAGLAAMDGGRLRTVLALPFASTRQIVPLDGERLALLGSDKIIVVAKGRGSEMEPGGEMRAFSRMAAGPRGTLAVVGLYGISTFDGTAWTLTKKTDLPAGNDGQPPLLQDVAVDRAGTVWVTAYHALLYRRDGAFSAVPTEYLLGRAALLDEGGLLASNTTNVVRISAAKWVVVAMPGGGGLTGAFAVGPKGLVAAAALHDVRILRPGAGGSTLAMGPKGAIDARRVADLAVDGRGRVWVASESGLAAVAADGAVRQWRTGSDPVLAHPVQAIYAVGDGPEEAPVGKVRTGTVVGQVLRAGAPATGVALELCDSASMFMSKGQTPCSGKSFVRRATIGAKGTFELEGVPVGTYQFAYRAGPKWTILMGSVCCADMKDGQRYDIGTITVKEQ